MLRNHNTKSISEKKDRELEKETDTETEREKILLKQEVAVRRCSSKQVFLKILQYS